jgi:glycosyltransferase involved in cell wall biosynthesis
MLSRAAHLVGVSDFEARHFQQQLGLPPDQFSVILNGADSVARMPRVETPAGASNGAGPLIVSPGRLERYKGHHRVIQALPLVAEEFPHVRLRIAGAGPYGHQLRKLANDLGIGHRVEIARIPGEDRVGMARLLTRASLVAAMSDYEAYPIAVLEALSCGCKVLTADTSGLSQFGRYAPVRTIPPNSSPEAVAAAMIERLRAPEMSADLDLPTWASCSDQLEHLYYSIVRG